MLRVDGTISNRPARGEVLERIPHRASAVCSLGLAKFD
jgi:hypothetical protein